MTTKVTIFNHGPDPIQIGLKYADNTGFKFEFRWQPCQAVGTAHDYYVHSGQLLTIVEARNALTAKIRQMPDDPPGCIACGAIAGVCSSYPNCPGGGGPP